MKPHLKYIQVGTWVVNTYLHTNRSSGQIIFMNDNSLVITWHHVDGEIIRETVSFPQWRVWVDQDWVSFNGLDWAKVVARSS